MTPRAHTIARAHRAVRNVSSIDELASSILGKEGNSFIYAIIVREVADSVAAFVSRALIRKNGADPRNMFFFFSQGTFQTCSTPIKYVVI